MSRANYPLDEVARAWLVKMRGEDAPHLRSEFEAWLAAAPEHRRSYHRIAHAMEQAAILKSSPRYGLARGRAASPSPRRRWLPIGLATAATMVLAAVGTNLLLPTGPKGSLIAARAAEPLVTRRGEIRTFHLPGGGTATLDTDSRLEFVKAGDARHLRLTRGLARLDFSDGTAAFQIEAGGSVLSGNKAELDIGIVDGSAIVIRVLRGSAQMASRSVTGAADTILPRRGPLRYRPTGGGPERAQIRARELPSADWPTGWSEHRSIPLAALAREANRYTAQPIIIDDPATGRIEVSGRFQISRPETVANRLGQLFDLAVERRNDAIHLRKR